MKPLVNNLFKLHSILLGGFLVFASALALPVWGQADIKTDIRLVDPGWKAVYSTDEAEGYTSQNSRNGKKQTILSNIHGVRFEQNITDRGMGSNQVLIVLQADTTRWIECVYFCIELPESVYGKGSVVFGEDIQVDMSTATSTNPKKCPMYQSDRIRMNGMGSSIDIRFRAEKKAFVCRDPAGNAVLYIALTEGQLLQKGNSLQTLFTMLSTGEGTVALTGNTPKETISPVVEAPEPAASTIVHEEPSTTQPGKVVQPTSPKRAAGYAIATASNSNAQTEVMAWGNMTGIRMDGELMAFETSFRLVEPGWKRIHSTGKEQQSYPMYTRNGSQQTVVTNINKIRYEQVVNDTSTGRNNITVTVRADTTLQAEGTYFCMELPADRYASGSLSVDDTKLSLSDLNHTDPEKASRYRGARIQVNGDGRALKLEFRNTVSVFAVKEPSGNTVLYIGLMPGKTLSKGSTQQRQFSMEASGEIDNERVEVAIDRTNPGRLFDGLGGNFRLQNPRQDPKVINYCLDNMRVAWGRVEMPWRYWQVEENSDPIAEARSGRLNGQVKSAMEMAGRLKAMGMPVIVSAWFPPVWAIDGDPAGYVNRGGVTAYRLDPRKKEKVYQSITDYLVYLKQEYGVEAAMYSFNESDLGIDVFFTPKEHATFIKELGAYMASRGLATKVLLGDNSDATTFDFILPAMKDPETYPYIGAVSFHSWRGCDDATLHKWAEASRTLNVPLIVGEGSTDAAAWRYPQIFGESTFALYEINLYMRICAICQPQSILQWQLTSDYSILLGDGIFGTEGPLRRTQRYWNLKQLAATPEQSFALPFTCTKDQVNCAAFGNIARGEYAVHMVNNGAARPATIKGLPQKTGDVKVYVTTASKGMEEVKNVVLNRGTVTFELPAASFATVITMP